MKTLFTILAGVLLITSCHKEEPQPEPTPPAPVTTIGATYAGGIVFYLTEDGQHGMSIGPEIAGVKKWAPANELVDDTEWGIGYGLSNTQAICNKFGEGDYAAKACLDLTASGYSDWYLPSAAEFIEVIKSDVLGPGAPPNPNLGNYWTSCEANTSTGVFSYITSWTAVLTSQTYKTDMMRVRPVRSF